MDFGISVIVPVKDRFDLAEIAIISICNQTRKVDEIIVVDDGSKIPAENELSRIVLISDAMHIKILFVRNETSKGVSAARNLGARNAKSDILMFCDSDDYWLPQKVEMMYNLMESNGFDGVHMHAFGWIGGTLLISKLLPKARLVKLPPQILYLFGCLSPSCLCLNKHLYSSGFDENIRYHEDLEFAIRMASKTMLWYYNYPLTIIGRPPFSSGGATENSIAFRNGAISVLKKYPGTGTSSFLCSFKILYHRIRIWKAKRKGSI